MNMMNTKNDEVLERVRRIETRLTKLLTHFGVNPGVEKPRWENEGIIRLPSRRGSIQNIVDTIPQDWKHDEGVDVFVGDDYVCTVYIDKP